MIKKRKQAKSKSNKKIHFSNMHIFAVTLALLLSLVVVTNLESFVPGITGAATTIQTDEDICNIGCPATSDAGCEYGKDGRNDTDSGCTLGNKFSKDDTIGKDVCEKGTMNDGTDMVDSCKTSFKVTENWLECNLNAAGKHLWIGTTADFDCPTDYICYDGACHYPGETHGSHAGKMMYQDSATNPVSTNYRSFDILDDGCAFGCKWYMCDAYGQETSANPIQRYNQEEATIDLMSNLETVKIAGNEYICFANDPFETIAECCGNNNCVSNPFRNGAGIAPTAMECGSPDGCRAGPGYVLTNKLTSDNYICMANSAWCHKTQITETNCVDGADNDCDGSDKIDCADSDCSADPACQAKKTSCTENGFMEYNYILQNCAQINATLSNTTVGCCEVAPTNKTCAALGGFDCDKSAGYNCISKISNYPLGLSADILCCNLPRTTYCKKITARTCSELNGMDRCNLTTETCPGITILAASDNAALACCDKVCEPITKPAGNCSEQAGKLTTLATYSCPNFNWTWTNNDTAQIKCCAQDPVLITAMPPLPACWELYGDMCNLTTQYCPDNVFWTDAFDNDEANNMMCCKVSCERKSGYTPSSVTPPIIPASTEVICSGCYNATTGICLPVTARSGGKYCDYGGGALKPQKTETIACESNFECAGNVCADGKCTGVREALGLIYKIWYYLRCWIASPTDAELRDVCTGCATDATSLSEAEECFGG